MLRLLNFLYQKRLFLLFLFLEAVSFWLIFNYHKRYNTYFLNTSNTIAGSTNERIYAVQDYFRIRETNKELYTENLELRRMLARENIAEHGRYTFNDTTKDHRVYPAKVINADYLRSRNFITLKIQPEDSIKPDMGVISSKGVMGRVKSVSSRYATVYSLLDPNVMTSARVVSNRALGTVQWDGRDPLTASLKYIPRHLPLNPGDAVVTSGFDGIFPEGLPIGKVSEVQKPLESPFYEARVVLATDFTTVEWAYIVAMEDQMLRKTLIEEEYE
jgi:rod shape-determining protein MreC